MADGERERLNDVAAHIGNGLPSDFHDASPILAEDRIKKGDLDALLARWEFGKQLLEERSSTT
jgi:hypothetical protein